MADNRYKISDIANLYSRVQWEKMKPLPGEDAGRYKLFVPSQPDGIRIDVKMLRGEMPTQNGFVLTINNSFEEDVVPLYLGFELMSIAGSVAILYDRENKNYKTRLTKKVLADHTIVIPDFEHQLLYADSFSFVERLKCFLSKKKEDRYNQLRMSVFAEVMDALSLEQAMGTFFDGLDIHIYEPWKELIEKYDRKNIQNMNRLFGELISQDSDVMNGVRKVRIAIKNMTELYEKV